MAQYDPANAEACSAAFRKLTSFAELASILAISTKQLGFYLNRGRIYRTFKLNKRTGGQRQISVPRTGLFHIQRKLVPFFHSLYRYRSPVHGFVPGRSIRSNAHQHLHSSVVMNLDLKQFFPSITFARLYGLFQRKPYSLPSNVATMIARLCTIPEGSCRLARPLLRSSRTWCAHTWTKILRI